MSLPQHFCWTRYGTEAGEGIEGIIRRKEEERQSNGGTFLWGIGNAIGPSMRALVRCEPSPEVVFSPIRSAARAADENPERVVVWTGGRTLDGCGYQLPRYSLVTSRASLAGRRKKHYALVCALEQPLRIDNDPAESLCVNELKNMLTGNPVGASQVTAVVRMVKNPRSASKAGAWYSASIRAKLVYPYLVEMTDFLALPDPMARQVGSGRISPASVLEFVMSHRGVRDSVRTLELALPL